MSHDAFGEMLKAQLESEEDVWHVLERDDGYLDIMSGKFYFSSPEQWSEVERRVVDRAQGSVLDLGCGAGRHALYLQERGHNVLAMDISPGAIEVCKARGVRQAQVGSMLDLEFLPSGFDVLLLGNILPIYGGIVEMTRALRHFYGMTPDAGRLIFNMRLYDAEAEMPAYHLEYLERNRAMGRKDGEVRFRVRYQKLISDLLRFLTPTREQYDRILADTEWRVVLEEMEGQVLYQVLEK